MRTAIALGIIAAAAVLGGCEGYSFHTNLDPQNFKEYYKTSGVNEYSNAQLSALRYHSLGTVTGLSCQVKDTDYIATEAQARTRAKEQAADKGANAIVFSRCVRLEETPACAVSVTCYGEAFIADHGEERSDGR